jgi:hypothetical protein
MEDHNNYIFSIAICIIFIFKELKNTISSLILVIFYLKYNKKMEKELDTHNIKYLHIDKLGGRRQEKRNSL